MKDFNKLEDYGIISNLETCALVGRDGSIDWCCLPHLESPSVFAAILDVEKGGHFSIRPSESFESEQSYIEQTNILQTTFHTPSGVVVLTDFMAIRGETETAKQKRRTILRKVACTRGKAELKAEFKPRFDYARAVPALDTAEGGIAARWHDHVLFLQTPFSLQSYDDKAQGTFSVNAGETHWFVLQYGHYERMHPEDCEALLNNTVQVWMGWMHRCEPSKCVFGGPWHELVVRSSLVLKLLTHYETGAIAAAPTTSLPEEIGGVRNWDYRFSWIRDASFTVQALYNIGYVSEAKNYLKWLMSICTQTKEPSEIKIMYGMHGESDIEECELDHLSGYRNSQPVRIGNSAVRQRQLDIYGELVNSFYETSRYGEDVSSDVWHFINNIVDYVCKVWNTKDAGIWEVRGSPQHFVYSKLMCWVALDRGIKIAKLMRFEAPLDRWEKIRNEIKNAILQRGFNRKLNSFVQSLDSETLDATSLLIPMMGFLPFDDPRVQGTIDATLERLMTKDGLVYRYQREDGLPGKEGAFTLCSFWLVNVLAISGRVDEAEKIFTNLLKYVSPLGLLAEEIDPDTGEQLGNFPQAFSHIGLINSALYLGRAKGRRQMGPEPLGDVKK